MQRKILASNYSGFPKLSTISEEECYKKIFDESDTKK